MEVSKSQSKDYGRALESPHDQAVLALAFDCKIGLQEQVPRDQATAFCDPGSPACCQSPFNMLAGEGCGSEESICLIE